MDSPTTDAALLQHCIKQRLQISSEEAPSRHTFDLFTPSPNSPSWSHQAEQLNSTLISIIKAHNSDDSVARIVLVSGNVANPPVLAPLTATVQQLILRSTPQDDETEKEPMIWAFCSRYFCNSVHDGPDAVVKSLIVQLQKWEFFPVKGFDYEMGCDEFEFALELLKSILSPEQKKLNGVIGDLWIILDYPSFFFSGYPDTWFGKMERLIGMLAEAVRQNSALRLVVTDPGKMNETVHRALRPCVCLSWEAGRSQHDKYSPSLRAYNRKSIGNLASLLSDRKHKEKGWFDIEEL